MNIMLSDIEMFVRVSLLPDDCQHRDFVNLYLFLREFVLLALSGCFDENIQTYVMAGRLLRTLVDCNEDDHIGWLTDLPP